MGELYYYVWEFVTSVTIIILVAAYIIHDRLTLKYEKLDEKESALKLDRLSMRIRITLGLIAFFGGLGWMYYMQTHTLYISKELEGFHNLVPAIIMSVIGLIVLGGGIQKYLKTGK
jgi:formate hydrogenlyase subunit 3/multisubunit Na+/H+ antiporter MnhD subunit